tara:strand:- start:1265 stop:1783 length:519 start_codon:yes stop_codon:yes gene_type:complete
MKSLILYSTTDGHTKKISEFIKLNSKKNNFQILPIDETYNISLADYDLIVIGASIRYGNHNPKVFKFIKQNIEVLKKAKNAFFSVNVVARKEGKNTPDTNPYIRKFIKRSNWAPMKLGVFAGKVDYPNYNFINKAIIRFIMFITKGPTDTSQSYEFTNWDDIKSFAIELDRL